MNAWQLFGLLVFLQVTVCATIALVAMRCFRHSAASRHAIGATALVCLALAPVLAAVLPRAWFTTAALEEPTPVVVVAVPAAEPPRELPAAAPLDFIPAPMFVPAERVERALPPLPVQFDPPAPVVVANIEPPTPPAEKIAVAPASQRSWLALGCDLAALFWIVGVVLLTIRALRRRVQLRQLAKSAQPAQLSATLLDEVRESFRIAKLPAIVVSDQLSVPCVLGCWRPRVVLPRHLVDAGTPLQLQQVLIHECAHIVRGDPWVNMLQLVVGILYWPQPAVSLLNRELTRAREEVVDNHVLQSCDSADYAQTLLDLAEQASGPTWKLIPLGLFGRWTLEERIAGLLSSRRETMTHASRRLLVGAVLLFGGISFVLGGAAAKEQAPPTEVIKEEVKPANVTKKSATIENDVAPNNPSAKTEAKVSGPVVVHGRIVLADGKPAVGADVAVVGRKMSPRQGGDFDPQNRLIAETKTDAEGKYRLKFPGVSQDTYSKVRAIASSGNSALAWKEFNLAATEPEVSFQLQPEELILGRLVDRQGQPVVGVRLRFNAIRKKSADELYAKNEFDLRQISIPPAVCPVLAATDEQGRFAVQRVPKGYGVSLEFGGNEQLAPQIIYLNTGEVPGGDGVSYQWLVKNVKPGKVAELQLAPAQWITGTVSYADTGEPVPHARLKLGAEQQEYGTIVSIAGKADEHGRYRLNPYPGVRFFMYAYPPAESSYLALFAGPLNWTNGVHSQNFDVKLPRGVLVRGQVLEEGTNTPIAGAAIQYLCEEKNNKHYSGQILTRWADIHLSDAQGKFAMAVLPGLGRLLVHAPKNEYIYRETSRGETQSGKPGGDRFYAHDYLRIDPAVDAAPLDVTLRPKRGATVNGTIVDPAGKPVEHGKSFGQFCFNIPELAWGGVPSQEFSGGKFEISGIAPDRAYPCYFFDSDRRLGATAILKAGMDPPRVVLQPYGQAKLRLVDDAGKPVTKNRVLVFLLVTSGTLNSPEAYKKGELFADSDAGINFDPANHRDDPEETDSEGRMVIPALIPGANYRIMTLDKDRKAVTKDFQAPSGTTLDLGDIVVGSEAPQDDKPEVGKTEPPPAAATGELSVVCRDEKGNAVAGARVCLYRTTLTPYTFALLQDVKTNGVGKVTLKNIEASSDLDNRDDRRDLYLMVAARGFVGTGKQLASTALPKTETAVEMDNNTGSLTGTVIDEAGQPIKGVTVFRYAFGRNTLLDLETVTDEHGKFRIDDLGRWNNNEKIVIDAKRGITRGEQTSYVYLRHPDYAMSYTQYKGIPQDINVTLLKPGIIEGHVLDAVTGKALANVPVSAELTSDDILKSALQSATTDPQGKYRLLLNSGRYNIWAEAAERMPIAIESLHVTANKSLIGTDISMVRGGFVTGRLLDNHAAIPQKNLSAFHVAHQGPARPASGRATTTTKLQPDGTFRIHVAPGKNRVYLLNGNASVDVNVEDGGEAKVELHDAAAAPAQKTGVISVLCRDEKGNAVADARVRLYRLSADRQSLTFSSQATTDREGRAKLAGFNVAAAPAEKPLFAYDLQLIATKPGMASASEMLYSPELPTKEIDCLLDSKPETLSGIVQDEDGKPIKGVAVFVSGYGNEPIPDFLNTVTDEAGKFRIDDLSRWNVKVNEFSAASEGWKRFPNTTLFSFSHPDYAPSFGNSMDIAQELRVTLHKPAIIEGRVIDDVTGKPLAHVPVFAQGIIVSNTNQTKTDQAGNYRFKLNSDYYNLWAVAADRMPIALKLQLLPGGKLTTGTDIQMTRGGYVVGRVIDKHPDVNSKPLDQLQVIHFGPARPYPVAAGTWVKVQADGTFRLHVAAGRNYVYTMYGTAGAYVNVTDGSDAKLELIIGSKRSDTERDNDPDVFFVDRIRSLYLDQNTNNSQDANVSIPIPVLRKYADTPTGRLLDKLDGHSHNFDRFQDGWLRTLKEIVDLGPAAVPELITELDSTQDGVSIRCLAFTLRSIGDNRAVPALIRAIPRTLQKTGSSWAMNSKNPELLKFAQEHDYDPSNRNNEYSFGTPKQEVFAALHKLTGQKFSEVELYHVYPSGTQSQQQMKRALFQQAAKTWTEWWEQHAREFVQDAAYFRVNLPEAAAAAEKSPGNVVLTLAEGHGGMSGDLLKSIYEGKATRTFCDLDTGRTAALPEKWRDASKEKVDQHLKEINDWAAGEGFDLMGTEIPDAKGDRHYALQGIGLRSWELTSTRWKNIPPDITPEELQREGTPTDVLLPNYDQQKNVIDPLAHAPFLVITREGTPVILNVGVEVNEAKDRTGQIPMADLELNPVHFWKGRRFGYQEFSEAK